MVSMATYPHTDASVVTVHRVQSVQQVSDVLSKVCVWPAVWVAIASPLKTSLLYRSNARSGTAHTKGRGDVTGTGAKPWNQKGTGRARHGDKKSPIWKGGGVAHGPTSQKNYTKKINKNARARALAIALSKKFADGEVVFLDTLAFAAPKTKDARAVLTTLGSIEGKEALATRRKNAVTLILADRDENTEKSFEIGRAHV